MKEETLGQIIEMLTEKVNELEQGLYRTTAEKNALMHKFQNYCQAINDDPVKSYLLEGDEEREAAAKRLENMAIAVRKRHNIHKFWNIKDRIYWYDEEIHSYGGDIYSEEEESWPELDKIRRMNWQSVASKKYTGAEKGLGGYVLQDEKMFRQHGYEDEINLKIDITGDEDE